MIESSGAFLIGLLVAVTISFFIFRILLRQQKDHFKVLAQEIFEQNSKQLQTSSEQNLSAIVKPLNDKMKEYQELMHLVQKSETQDRESLREKMQQMIVSAKIIESEASQLTQALSSDVKFQGNWGELVLEKVLELSGLEKGREFFTQSQYKDEEKVLKPDVVVSLPGDSSLIIDSKVSLKAFFNYQKEPNANSLKEIKTSVNQHIVDLGKKNYQNVEGVLTPEFIFMFVPVEGVYALIIKEFPELIEEALKRNIILVSPINLMANLKTVASLWRVEKQSKSSAEIAAKAGAMYDKFALLLEELEKLGSSLDRSQNLYKDIQKKIHTGRGNLIERAQELRDKGAKVSKNINISH